MPENHHRTGGGLTPEVLLFAALLVLPALWHCVVDGDLAFYVAIERYLLVAVGCAVVSSLVHGYSESGRVVRARLERLEAEPAQPAAAEDRGMDRTGGLLAGAALASLPGPSPFDLDAPDLLGIPSGGPLGAPPGLTDDTLIDLAPGLSPFAD